MVEVNKPVKKPMFVPVFSKNAANTRDWSNSVTTVISSTQMVSIRRSVTTVPSDLEKETPSYFDRIPQRETSPTRGTTRLAAYDTKTAYTLFDTLGYSPNGANVRFQRQPRNRCPSTPNTSEKAIQP